jgi:hypothetical protein
MKRRTLLTLAASALLCAGIAVPAGTAVAQSAKDLVGAWVLVSNVTTAPNGRKTDAFGANPKGTVIFDGSGRYVNFSSRTGLPKFSSGDRMRGTPGEYKAIVQGSLAHLGTYSVADKVLTFKVETSTWPGQTGTDLKQTIVSLSADTLHWTVAGPGASKGDMIWKRVK